MDTETTYTNVPISGKNGAGYFTKIDNDDLHLFAGRSVSMRSAKQLRPCIKIGGKRVYIYHLLMCNPPTPTHTIDHINNDPLDNRKVNLRWSSKTEQSMNTRKTSKKCSSMYKGVYFNKQLNKWHARIKINSISKHLGYFDDEKDAARAYNQKALELNAEFYHINEISDDEEECDDDISETDANDE